MICAHTWYLSTDQMEAVPKDDPRAYFLLVNAGQEIIDSIAQKYRLMELEAELESKALQAPPENKAVSMPPQVKRMNKPRLVKKAKR